MASFDRKAFLSLPTGSSYLMYSSNNNHYSLYTRSSTHIFCARTPPGFVFAAKGPQKITHEQMLAHAEDDPAELLKVMDALGKPCAESVLMNRWLPLPQKSSSRNVGGPTQKPVTENPVYQGLSGFWGGRGPLPSTLIRSYSPSAYGAVRDSARLG